MPTPSIQTLTTDAQQVLNLTSISAIRSVVAVSLANANTGTPLNPNLTTQQLWDEFYQVVTQPKSDIESIIANQLMKFLYAPPAPGGVGANRQVIFNDNGVLAGDAGLTYNKATDALTITGDLTVDTNVLKVDSTNNRVGIGTASPHEIFTVSNASGNVIQSILTSASGTGNIFFATSTTGANSYRGYLQYEQSINALLIGTNSAERARIDSSGNLGLGVTPSAWVLKSLQVVNGGIYGSGNETGYYANAFYGSSGWRYINAAGASGYLQNGGSHQWYRSTSANVANTDPVFSQAMTLDASGNLLVGTTSNTNGSRIFARGTASSSALAIQGASGDVALAQLTVGKFDNDSTTSQIFVRFTINDNSGGSGQINANGASQAAFGSFSDSRLKENIVSLPSQLANILSLRPVEFDYKDGSGHQIGFVAQEMQEVYSDAVGEQDGFLTVTGWSKTEARLVSAIKELAAKVQTLEAKLA